MKTYSDLFDHPWLKKPCEYRYPHGNETTYSIGEKCSVCGGNIVIGIYWASYTPKCHGSFSGGGYELDNKLHCENCYVTYSMEIFGD